MKPEPPMKAYVLITIFVFIAITVVGLAVNSYLSKKFPEKKEEKVVKKTSPEPDEVAQARAVLGLAGVIFVLMIIVYATFKLATRQPKL